MIISSSFPSSLNVCWRGHIYICYSELEVSYADVKQLDHDQPHESLHLINKWRSNHKTLNIWIWTIYEQHMNMNPPLCSVGLSCGCYTLKKVSKQYFHFKSEKYIFLTFSVNNFMRLIFLSDSRKYLSLLQFYGRFWYDIEEKYI